MEITYINKRLLKLDVKSVIRKGNDGILSTAHILGALSMKFKKRNLEDRRKLSEFQSRKAKSSKTSQVNKQSMEQMDNRFSAIKV